MSVSRSKPARAKSGNLSALGLGLVLSAGLLSGFAALPARAADGATSSPSPQPVQAPLDEMPAASPEPEPESDAETGDASETESDESETFEPEPEKPSPSPEAAVLPKIGGRNISAFTRNLLGNTSIGGYFDTEYYFPADRHSFFDQHHLILQVSALPHERLFFNTEIEYEHGAILGTGTNDGQLKVEQAYLDFQIVDGLIFRGGALLVPVGRLNILHDSDFRDTTVRPLFSTTIMPTTWTEAGAGFYGTLYPDEFWEITYEAYVVQGLREGLSGANGLSGARNSVAADNNGGKGFTARVGASPFIGLDFGLGTYLSAYSDDGKKNLGLVVGDLSWTAGPFELVGEGGFAAFDPTSETNAQGEVTPLIGPMWGYYVEARYHLFPEFLQNTFLDNGFEQPVFTLFAQLSQVDTDASRLDPNDRTRIVLGLNFRPVTNTVFKLEYQWNIENEAILRNDPSKEVANNQLVASVATGF